MTWPRLARALGLLLTGVTALALALNTSALPVVLDLRPALLGIPALALVLLAVGWRSALNRGGRAVLTASALLAGFALATTLRDVAYAYRAEEVAFQSDRSTLRGTLYLPRGNGPHPAVVLVHGSGRQPRREYAYFARAYARRGIAALAYDKRGSGASEGNGATATYEDLAADAAAAVALLRGRADIDARRVGIRGTSEGEWVAPLAATMTDPAFLVLVSPSAMTPTEQVRYETGVNVLEAGFGAGDAQRARDLYGRLAEFQRSGTGRDDLNQALAHATREPWFEAARYLEPSVPDYETVQRLEWFPAWRARMDFDAGPLLARLACPVLAQVGGRDPKNDGAAALARLEAALRQGGNTAFTGIVYPEAGHGLIEWRLPFGLPPPWLAPGYPERELDWVAERIGASGARAARPRRPGALGNVERGEHAERLHADQEVFALLLQRLHLVVELGEVLLVHEHLAPVLDEEVARRRGEILQEGTAQEGAAASRELRPLAVRPVEPFELLATAGNGLELPHDCDQRFTSDEMSVYQAPPPGRRRRHDAKCAPNQRAAPSISRGSSAWPASNQLSVTSAPLSRSRSASRAVCAPGIIWSKRPAERSTRVPVSAGTTSGSNGTIARRRMPPARTPGRESIRLAAMFAPFE